jgi:multidrug efflux pump subunit AcrB
MRKIISTFVKYPFYANIIIVFIVIAGLISLGNMKMSFFPETTSRFISISVFYPGASPIEMEEGVTSRIEEAIRSVIGIKEITSTSRENASTVMIETTGQYDIDETLMDVKNAVDGISAFPSAAERPIVFKQRNTSRALFITLSGVEDLFTLKNYAYRIEDDFLNSGVISQMTLRGAPTPEISVEIRETELLRYNLTLSEVANAIWNNNRDISGGQIKSSTEEIMIRLRSRSADPDVIADITLRGTESGGFLRIRDVATVKMKAPDDFYPAYRNGKPSVSFLIEKLPDEDLEAIDSYVKNYTEKFNNENSGVQLKLNFSFLEILQSRLQVLMNNGMLGFLLVVISLTLFLSFGVSLWVAWGIPASFLAMFIFANLYGITINMVSLFGMILVIGILVDDGIVIGENIYTYFEEGSEPMHAAVDGTMEVLPAVFTSISTTVVAFSPLLFLQGTNMETQFEMAFIVIFSLLLSLVEAFFVLPAHLGNKHILNRERLQRRKHTIKKAIENTIVWLRDHVYGPYIVWAVHWRYVMLTVPLALFMITTGLFMGGFIKNTYFPVVDFDSFEINMAFVPGSGEEQTYKYLHKFEKAVWDINDTLKVQMNRTEDLIRDTRLQVGRAFSGQENGAHAGQLVVYSVDLTNMDLTGLQIAEMVREKIGAVPESEKYTVGGRNRWGAPVAISLMSRNLDQLQAAKNLLIGELKNMPILKDIVDNNAQGKQEILLKLKPRAYFLGLDEAEIAGQIRQGFYGYQVQRLQHSRDEIRVWVRYPRDDRSQIGQLEKMKIKTAQGAYPMSELADYTIKRGPVGISRFNGQREMRIEAELEDAYASVPDILAQIDANIIPKITTLYPAINILYQGQQRESQQTVGKLITYFTIAFSVIILLLMIHFKSAEQSFIILAMIPLSFIGVFWGHWIHMKPISLLSVLGMVALSGVIINDAVIFLAKYNGLIVKGEKVSDAVVHAGKSRLRPIILTTLTTAVGLFPLLLERSHQAQFLIPMAISLAYGVAFGTIFILLFFPVLIRVLNDFRRSMHRLWTGVASEPEDVEIALIYARRKLE